ncbi:MAG: hypothetical protein NTW74_12690 [Acidobacteria bacterium]|nr:hypothetical protein [Acidobacteriota bacterium]
MHQRYRSADIAENLIDGQGQCMYFSRLAGASRNNALASVLLEVLG